MAQSSTKRTFWLVFAILGALSVTLAVGWWLDHRARSAELEALDLRAENDDLNHLFDEVYTLLNEEGFQIHLDLVVDKNGHYRLRADSAKLTDELKAALRQLNQKPVQSPPAP